MLMQRQLLWIYTLINAFLSWHFEIVQHANVVIRNHSLIISLFWIWNPLNQAEEDLNQAYQDIIISVEGYEIDEVNIYTLTSQQVLHERPVNGTVDISNLQTGMYIVEVTVENTRLRQKLMVQR